MAKKENWFDDVDDDVVEKCSEIPTTFPLPKVDDEPIEYLILDEPFSIETPNSRYNKTAIKIPVSISGVEGEIFVPKSLKTNIAISLDKLGMDFRKSKLSGMILKIWMSKGNDGFEYYHCTIRTE